MLKWMLCVWAEVSKTNYTISAKKPKYRITMKRMKFQLQGPSSAWAHPKALYSNMH